MISTTTLMIFSGTVFALLLGVVSGIFYSLNLNIASLLFCRSSARKNRRKFAHFLSRFLRHSYDFVSVIFIGVLLLLLLYVFCDGVINVYTILALFVGFGFGKSIVARLLELIRKNKH